MKQAGQDPGLRAKNDSSMKPVMAQAGRLSH